MKYLLLISFLSMLLFSSCTKKVNYNLPANEQSFVDSVFNYLNAYLPVQELQQLIPEKHIRLQRGKEDRLLLINYRDNDKFLIVEKTEGGFRGHIVQFKYTDSEKKDGSLSTKDMISKRGHKISFTNGIVTRVDPTTEDRVNSYAASHSNITSALAILPDKSEDVVVIYIFTGGGGGGSHGINLSSLYYMTDFNTQYYYSYTSAPTTGSNASAGRGGGSSSAVVPYSTEIVDLPFVIGGPKPIDITKELACFTPVAGANYTLRINVNQPEPNTREITNINASQMAGHTFLTLEQKNPDGSVTIRNIGWYPKGSAKPTDGTKAGQYQDDSGTPYCVSLSISVTAAEFDKVKNYLKTIRNYNVQTANCTNIAVDAFAQAGVTLPKTIGVINSPSNNYAGTPVGRFPIFKGVNPADLGEDIRGINANKLSQQLKRSVIIQKGHTNNQTRTNSAKCR